MTDYSQILSDNVRISNDAMADIAEELEESGLCTVESQEFVFCSNPEDPDYSYVPDQGCDGEVRLESEVCPECGRQVDRFSEKETFCTEFISVSGSGVRDHVRNVIKEKFNTNGNTINRTYCGESPDFALGFEDLDRPVFLLGRQVERDFLRWCKVYGENPVLVLYNSVGALQNIAKELNVDYIDINEVYPYLSECTVELLSDNISKLRDRMIRARAANVLTDSHDTLVDMKYDEFENAVHSMLLGLIGNSSLIGSDKSGKAVPDGVLNLHFDNNEHIYMWDGKFVKYNKYDKDSKTDLKGEYDKILRHMKGIKRRPEFASQYGKLQGIVLFSPAIREHTVSRLADFIDERLMMGGDTWDGTVCYFTLEALKHLFKGFYNNKNNIRMKNRGFRNLLHQYMQDSERHDDPEEIQSMNHKCVKFGLDDTRSLFSKIEVFEAEEKEFNVREYMIKANVN